VAIAILSRNGIAMGRASEPARAGFGRATNNTTSPQFDNASTTNAVNMELFTVGCNREGEVREK